MGFNFIGGAENVHVYISLGLLCFSSWRMSLEFGIIPAYSLGTLARFTLSSDSLEMQAQHSSYFGVDVFLVLHNYDIF